MKDIKNFLVNEAVTSLTPNSRVTPQNVHDAILNVCFKYMNKPVSKEVKDYCNKVREALESIK